ncbi:MAG: methionyl-tRNA formyltransferase [Propionibacteriales bacterium]|nr:methionyl-tRNA formyltransferase [Propionibacteriales bacterium]
MSSEVQRARVLLVGLGPTAGSALAALLERFEVVALVRDESDEVSALAAAAGVRVEHDTRIADLEDLMDRTHPDCVVVSSYHRILPRALLNRCPFVNVHYAPLPRYRGRANVNWAILNGEPEAAVTVHSMVPGLDAGGVLAQQSVPIADDDTVGTLYTRLNEVQRGILAGAVTRRLAGDEGDPQDEAHATYGCTRVPDDGEIDWRAGTVEIDRLVRALGAPYPGAFTFLGLRRLWVLQAEPAPAPRTYDGRIPGRVIANSADAGWADVLTGDGVLRLHRVHYDGGEPLPASAVVHGSRQTLGLRTRDLLVRIDELEERLRDRLDASSHSPGSGG